MANRGLVDKPLPGGWPRISGAVFYDEPARAIDWLCQAFGFEVRLKVEGEGGRIEHSELTMGEGLIMVGSAGGRSGTARGSGGNGSGGGNAPLGLEILHEGGEFEDGLSGQPLDNLVFGDIAHVLFLLRRIAVSGETRLRDVSPSLFVGYWFPGGDAGEMG